MSEPRARLALAAAAAVGVQVGLATVASRFAIGETTPAALALMRYVIGFLCLLPMAIAAGRIKIAACDIVPICGLGIIQFGVLIALLNYGLKTIPAGRAALILATFPLITMVLGSLLGHETMTLRRATAVLITIAGVGLALAEKLGGGGAVSWHGEAAVAGAAIAGASCAVLYRPYLRRYPTLPVSALAMLASVVALVPAAWVEGMFERPFTFSATASAAILFIGVSSGVGYFLWLWALTHAPATQVTIFMTLSPLTAGLVGAALLGEPLTRHFAAGVAAVAIGLWLATRHK